MRGTLIAIPDEDQRAMLCSFDGEVVVVNFLERVRGDLCNPEVVVKHELCKASSIYKDDVALNLRDIVPCPSGEIGGS